MSEEVKNVHREPHPFVGHAHMANFVGRPIAFVGRIQTVNDGELVMHQNDRKYSITKANEAFTNFQFIISV